MTADELVELLKEWNRVNKELDFYLKNNNNHNATIYASKKSGMEFVLNLVLDKEIKELFR